MKSKVSKSILVTGLAAAGFVAGVEEVHADTPTDKIPEKNSDVNASTFTLKNDAVAEFNQLKPETNTAQITAEIIEVTSEQVEASRQLVEEQLSQVHSSKQELDHAQSVVNQAKEELATKEQNVKDATPENIKKAQDMVVEAEKQVTARQEDVKTSQQAEDVAKDEVTKQSNVVAGKQTLVDVAEEAVKQAEQPVHAEKVALEDAQKAVESAKAEVQAKTAALTNTQTLAQNRDQAIAQARQKVVTAEKTLAARDAAIAQKEAEAKTAPTTVSVAQQYSYANFLDYLQGQANNATASDLAKEARAELLKEKGNEGTNGASTYQNALTAVQIAKEINRVRKAAGLPELYIHAFNNVKSQIMAEISSGNGFQHTFKYKGLENENLAWGFDPKGAVDFWQSEKAAYQQVAAQYGLPTDERQIDANAIYMRLSKLNATDAFARIGHYVQDMGNKFNVLSVASVNGLSEVAYQTVGNLQQLIQAGVVMTVDQYEKQLQAFSAALSTGFRNRPSNASAELANLKAQRTGDLSRLNIAKAELNNLLQGKAADASTIRSAQLNLQAAQLKVQTAEKVRAEKEQTYKQAYAAITSRIAPLQAELKNKQADLSAAQKTLQELQTTYQSKQAQTKAAQEALLKAQEAALAAKKRVFDLENAPENLKRAKADLEQAKLNLSAAMERYEKEVAQLNKLKAVYDRLRATYQSLEEKYRQLHPELAPLVAQHPAVGFSGRHYADRQEDRKLLPSTGTRNSDALLLAGMLLGGLSLGAGFRRKED